MQVRELMSTPVVTVDVDASLDSCAGRMLGAGVGSVVVVDGEDPVGIVTESDVLSAALHTGRPLQEVSVRATMSAPIVHVRPSATVRTATDRMEAEGIKKLLVTVGTRIEGIVTVSDVVRHLPEIRREEHEKLDGKFLWENSDRYE
jgi:signal-transduction protein with cAMP-binding, CBS, and nucleotidyltransferase domain